MNKFLSKIASVLGVYAILIHAALAQPACSSFYQQSGQLAAWANNITITNIVINATDGIGGFLTNGYSGVGLAYSKI